MTSLNYLARVCATTMSENNKLVIEAHFTIVGNIGAIRMGELVLSTSLPCLYSVIDERKKGTIIQTVVV